MVATNVAITAKPAAQLYSAELTCLQFVHTVYESNYEAQLSAHVYTCESYPNFTDRYMPFSVFGCTRIACNKLFLVASNVSILKIILTDFLPLENSHLKIITN